MKKRLCETCIDYEGNYPYGECLSDDVEREVITNILLSVKWDKDYMHVIECDSHKEQPIILHIQGRTRMSKDITHQ